MRDPETIVTCAGDLTRLRCALWGTKGSMSRYLGSKWIFIDPEQLITWSLKEHGGNMPSSTHQHQTAQGDVYSQVTTYRPYLLGTEWPEATFTPKRSVRERVGDRHLSLAPGRVGPDSEL
jgi:hypothetical protein